MTRSVKAFASLLVLAFAAACASSPAGDDADVRVIAAFYPIEEAVRTVGGDGVAVTNITPPGGEPHDLELTPSDVVRLRDADLIFYLGGGFQPALEDAVEALPDRSRAIDLLDGLPLREGEEAHEDEHGDEHAEEEGEHAEDPHVWLDPTLFARMVTTITNELAARAPGHADAFRERAAAYRATLERLDERFRTTLRTCERDEIFTTHAAFGYLTARYGLEQIPITGISPEAEPSPRRLEEVARLARERGATTIYFETLVSPRVAQTIARSVGADTAVLNPIEGLTAEERARGETYVSLMEQNLQALADGLGCER